MKPIRLVADDVITDDDFESLQSWLGTKPRLSQGPEVAAFEREWSDWLGVKHSVFCNSGSSANLLAYAALVETSFNERQGRVYAPAVSWPTTITPAMQFGLHVELGDAHPMSWGLATDRLEEALKRNVGPWIVVLVDVLGVPADRDALLALKDKYEFWLIEDVCGAHGATWNGKKVGTFGDLSTFSFFVGHHATSGEGGMVCTNDDYLNRMLRMLRAHGWASDLSEAERETLRVEYDVVPFREKFTFFHAGFTLRNTEFAAKLGRLQLQRLDEACTLRRTNYQRYEHSLSKHGSAWAHYPQTRNGLVSPIAFAFLAGNTGHGSRGEVSKRLTAAGVEHRPVGGGNMARQPFLRAYQKLTRSRCDVADAIHDRAIQVPCHPGLTPDDIERVVAAIKGDA